MKQIWFNEDEGELGGVRFKVGHSNYDQLKTSADLIWVLKGKKFFDRYDTYFGKSEPRTVLEIGIFEGGSALLLADRWPNAKIVGVDIREQNENVFKHAERLGVRDRMSLHYKTSQDDVGMMRRIVKNEFPDGLDLVIDDASHLYPHTAASFDAVFPFLKPGGTFVVEDWAWAHWADYQDIPYWNDKQALTNLLFEVCMSCGTKGYLISDVYVNGNFFAVKKADNCPTLSDSFKLGTTYILRAKELNRI